MHAVAMNRLLLLLSVVGLLVLAIIGLARRRKSGRRLLVPVSAATAALFLTVPFVGGMRAGEVVANAAETSSDGITVLSWNTGQDDVASTTIQNLAVDSEADIVVLPEYFGTVANAQLGVWASDNGFQILSREASTSSVLISNRLGAYSVSTEDAPPWVGFVAVPQDTHSPKLVVTHAEHARLWSAGLWNEHLNWVASQCSDPNVVAIGDFNATKENLSGGMLGACSDGASSLGQTQTGTWPASLPTFLGAQIDRVMTGSDWHTASFSVVTGYEGKGSDHRPILVRVQKGASQ